jgi:hypothetical protein
MINKKIAIGIGVFVCIALVTLYATTFLRHKTNTPKQEVPNAVQPEVASPVDTSDWLTYENKEYGYLFKYPTGVEVVDGKDPRYSFSDYPQSTFIILPAKDFSIKDPDRKNPESFRNYMIAIMQAEWYADESESGKTTEEVIQSLVGSYGSVSEVTKTANTTRAVYNAGETVILFTGKDLYEISLGGSNPKEKYVQGILEEINNPQLTEWVNNYPVYLRILKGVYSTFETF